MTDLSTYQALRPALLEWAAVVAALLDGRDLVLVRKGGIHERGGRFHLRHDRFWLIPTFLHQRQERLAPNLAADYWNEHAVDPDPDHLQLPGWAEVGRVWWVDQRSRLDALGKRLPLSAGDLDQRWQYRDEPGVFVVALRAHRLAEPALVPHAPRYAGCRSWLELAEELDPRPAQPVVDEATWLDRLHAVETMLGP